MSSPRIIYQNWIADLGRDPDRNPTTASGIEPGGAGDHNLSALEQLRRTVRSAVDALSARERFFVTSFYFQGLSYLDISEESGQTVDKLIALHRRTLRKLRRNLAPFVQGRFQIRTDQHPACPICRSLHRRSIDILIAGRDKSRSWRPVISALKAKYSLAIRSPQILIGHEKYH